MKRAPRTRLFAATGPGLEAVAADELRALGFKAVNPIPGGVDFVGDPLRANRWLAIPNRILQRVARYHAPSFDALVAGAAKVDWSPFGGLTPTVTCRKSRLYHSGAVAERLAAVVPPGPGQLFVRISRDRCTLSVDTSGELLHRRGWRLETGPAPLRETLAAGILRLAGWLPAEPLLDPMCGSGTFAIEAAVAASGRAPGGRRRFACEAWVGSREAPSPAEGTPATIHASDRAEAAVEAARRNAARAEAEIELAIADAGRLTPPTPAGLLICNPPYGRRVRGHRPYRLLGRLLTGPFADWRAAIVCTGPEQVTALGRPVKSRTALRNGGLPIELVVL